MKVAIIGAGVAGLSCAYELERYGITPTIFERNNVVGEVYPHVSAVMQLFNRPVRYPLEHLKRTCNIEIQPIGRLRRVTMIGPRTQSTVSGRLGDFISLGQTPDTTIEKQLESKVQSKIIFDTHADYKKLKDEFDYVVIATGVETQAKELGCWEELISTAVYGAVILGNFRTDTLISWFDTDYAKSGYVYLTPFNEKRASIALILPNSSKQEAPEYWNRFLRKQNIKNEIIQTFLTEHHSGFVFPHRVGNIFLTGLAGGCTDPFLGFGLVYSIVTGVSAARSIALGLDYEQQIKRYAEANKQVYEYRIALNKFSNDRFDVLIKGLGLPLLRNVIYNTNINVVKHGSKLLYLSRRFRRTVYRARSDFFLLKSNTDNKK